MGEEEKKDDKFENPTPKKGEKKQAFISRCIPIVHKEHPDWPDDKVQAVCYSIWRDKHKNSLEQEGYELFTSDAQLIYPKNDSKSITNNEVKTNQEESNGTHLIAIVGDRFMNGGFFSMEELKKCYKQWENTLHDLNHMGTSTGFFLVQQDVSYFVGYHKNVKLDEANKSVSMELHIDKDVPRSEQWEGFVGLCRKAGLIPNVSVTYYGKRKYLPASELPPEADWKKEGYGKDDLIPVLYNVIPVCVSTVFKGKCNDKDGCGIRNTNSKCGSKSCDCNKDAELEKIIKRIKEKEKQLSED